MSEKVIRNKDVVAAYNKPGATLESVGKLFGISHERVRQLLQKSSGVVCKIHKQKFYGSCKLCSIDDLYNRIIPMPELIEIIDRLKGRDKSKYVSYERSKLVEYLRKHLKLSLPFIGDLLNRDHTTIMHHLQK